MKTPVEVAAAFDDIVARAHARPRSIASDNGAKFREPFQQVLANHGIEAHQQYEDINAIATIDIAIGTPTQGLARDCTNNTANWQGRWSSKGRTESRTSSISRAWRLRSWRPLQTSHLTQKSAGFDAHNQNGM